MAGHMDDLSAVDLAKDLMHVARRRPPKDIRDSQSDAEAERAKAEAARKADGKPEGER